jgi:hypothetical protein
MGKLSAAARRRLPASDFAGPNRSFPVEDRAHAEAALRLVGRAVKAGSVTPAEAEQIRAKAYARLGEKPKLPPHVAR